MENLFNKSRKRIENTPIEFKRYLFDKINWDSNLIGITGSRGIGKTTLILQYLKLQAQKSQSLYFSTEEFYFLDNRIIELAESFAKQGGTHLFIDEIHKYPEWSRELKLIHDNLPELKVVFTGSSILDINKGAFDLSRRAVMYHLHGMSFREYLELHHQIKVPVYTLEDIIKLRVDTDIKHVLVKFNEYLRTGYYPFSIEADFDLKLNQMINQSIENDIPTYTNISISTTRKLKHLLSIIASSVPFKPNYTKIADIIRISRNQVSDYTQLLQNSELIYQLMDNTGGIRALGKVDKVYLNNTNLIYNLAPTDPNIGNLRESFFINQTRLQHNIRSSKTGDFDIEGSIFEVGGQSKTNKQIKEIKNAFLVKDDIEYGFMNTIPLWHFGLLY
jgi:predicted AAA+ superfamily ATPase